MPLYEGLPDGLCPKKANGRTVKRTQGDLMLCPACDAIRFPSVVARRTDMPSGSSAVSKKKDVAANARSKGADTQWPAVVPQIVGQLVGNMALTKLVLAQIL